jgi:VCBS repeat protein
VTTVSRGFRYLAFLIPIAVLSSADAATSVAHPTFSTHRTINVFVNGLLPFDVRTADIDRDGDLDIYTANYSGRIAWFENDGGNPPGSWVEHVLTDFADGAEATVAVRVDGDADVDFLSAAFNREEIAWWENAGDDESFLSTPITFDCRLCTDVWSADLDGDGDNDALSASGFDSKIVWYDNVNLGASWTPHLIGVAGESVEAADLDQDGDVDVVGGLICFDSDGGSPPTFAHERVIASMPISVNAIAILDVDRDGDPDVLSAGQDGDMIAWHENNGMLPSGWTSHIVTTNADFATFAYGADLDGDGDVDLLSSSFFDDTIAWYENDGASPPSFTKHAISTNADGARSVFAADIDRDGDMDVLSASQNDAQVVWHENDTNYLDTDHDGMRDELDCAASDGTAFRVPLEVTSVRFRSNSTLEWNSATAGSGSGGRYDVIRGTLAPGSGSAETCLANDATTRTLTDGDVPAPGMGFYYLIRASNACGVGTLGPGRSSEACPS